MEEYIKNLQLTLSNIHKVIIELQQEVNDIRGDIEEIKTTLYVDYQEEKGEE